MPTLRKASPKDASGIWNVRVSAIRGISEPRYPQADLIKWAPIAMPEDFVKAVEGNEWYVVTDNDMIVATGYVDVDKKRLEALFVLPKYQGQGIAKLMINHLHDIAKGHGLSELTLDATLNAEGFYSKHGYVKIRDSVHTSPLGVSFPAAAMKRVL